MFVVEIAGHCASGPDGTEAEFAVPTPVLALDLVLRAERAGLTWRVRRGPHPPASGSPAAGSPTAGSMSLAQLRDVADACSRDDPDQAAHLRAVDALERRCAAARLN